MSIGAQQKESPVCLSLIHIFAEAIRRGVTYETIHDITKIDVWFIDKLAILVEMENAQMCIRDRRLSL